MVEKDMTDEDMVTSIDTEDTPGGMTANPQPEDFAATLERLENLVERLESGELSLESSLDAFEQGIRLTRDAQRRLDEAELKVRTLTEHGDGGLTEAPFPLEEPGR